MEDKEAAHVENGADEVNEAEDGQSEAPPSEAESGASPEREEDKTPHRERLEELEKHVSKLERELSEMKDRYLRVQADLENFRRRTRKEKEEQAKYAALPVVKALLPALDNLERALDAARSENASSDGLGQGVEMVTKQMFDILKEFGLESIPSVGEPFNPEFHEAVMTVESEEHESGTVVEELQKGYLLKDRVIRPAMVKVSQ
ncbi:nucleotide exchange factor GrpE [Novibacillus thermophilus]|uniref:nucleotide exchange factor GrpE n=1 Tax=Novibacillus thermophilus TaxID=1471761 RepID=UPI001E35561E|nr:nucleotide exchange factor GrpE [Novibacillus thermophilus]